MRQDSQPAEERLQSILEIVADGKARPQQLKLLRHADPPKNTVAVHVVALKAKEFADVFNDLAETGPPC